MRAAQHSERGRSTGLTTKGLSLIEVIIILAVLAVLVALLVPSSVQVLTGARRDTTLDEMENLQIAMIGDPNLKNSGVRSSFGYIGDMGNLPATLDDLLTQGAQPAYAFNSSLGVGAGWRGPYITLGPGSDAESHRTLRKYETPPVAVKVGWRVPTMMGLPEKLATRNSTVFHADVVALALPGT